MVRPTLKKQIPNLQEAIKETAWSQIAEVGAPALSLRAIARKLKITAPAIYNYFADRDALVTALVIDAFTSFGDSQFEARDSLPTTNHSGRLKAIGMAYRKWAHTYPQRYQLIFGTPIPNYAVPAQQVFPSSARSITPLFSVVEDARASGKLIGDTFHTVKKEYVADFDMWKSQIGEIHPLTHYFAMIIWSRVHGMVSLELQGNLPPFGKTGDALYLSELDSMSTSFLKE